MGSSVGGVAMSTRISGELVGGAGRQNTAATASPAANRPASAQANRSPFCAAATLKSEI
jgi:hypothetical protein